MINCNYGLANTGTGCTPLFSVLKKIILVPYYDSTGTVNTVTTGSTLNSGFFSTLINNTDPSKRWFPLPFMKNVTNVRPESIKETFDDGAAIIVQQGVRKFMGQIIEKDASPQLLSRLLTARNLEMGFYGVDKDGNLIGMQDVATTTNLNPIRIDSNSIDPIFNPGEDKTVQKITLGFDIHVNEVDSSLAMVTASEMSINVGTLKGLIDVYPVYSAIATSSAKTFVVKLCTYYGSMISPQTVTGLVAADFSVYDVTTSASKTITSVSEALDSNGKPSGIYTFTMSATITAADVIRLTPSKTGFDFTQVVVTTFVSV